jgi:hypothetical protein
MPFKGEKMGTKIFVSLPDGHIWQLFHRNPAAMDPAEHNDNK